MITRFRNGIYFLPNGEVINVEDAALLGPEYFRAYNLYSFEGGITGIGLCILGTGEIYFIDTRSDIEDYFGLP